MENQLGCDDETTSIRTLPFERIGTVHNVTQTHTDSVTECLTVCFP